MVEDDEGRLLPLERLGEEEEEDRVEWVRVVEEEDMVEGREGKGKGRAGGGWGGREEERKVFGWDALV